ncbi:MAG TPA: hypothetical protein VN634_19120 [Candidatus Limnocylindrales bacterium]|nr:hypothetical protein [Candidatus Limnocylindrales bacterium]
MKFLMTGAFTLLGVLFSAQIAFAGCTADDPDGTKLAAARAQVAADCVCDQSDPPAVNHGDYVSCAAGIANDRSSLDRADPNYLPPTCKGPVKKCAAKSACGKPGFVSCCRSDGSSGFKCSAKSSAAACTDKGGVADACSSCCDACGANRTGPSCPVPTTTTTVP